MRHLLHARSLLPVSFLRTMVVLHAHGSNGRDRPFIASGFPLAAMLEVEQDCQHLLVQWHDRMSQVLRQKVQRRPQRVV